MDDLARVLRDLYAQQLKTLPDDSYLREHSEDSFVDGAVRVFRFYEPFLPKEGRILDWGCRHAPDACLIRARSGERITLDGCDILDGSQYPIFFAAAQLRYEPLNDIVRLPYADGSFDAVLASGVLEHVPMDHESLRELYRVLRVGGRLIVTYLPNRASVEEWRLRQNSHNRFHWRLYNRSELRSLLLHAGFRPIAAGFQTQIDLLPASGGISAMRPLMRFFQLHRLASCLCAVGEKVAYL